MQLKRLCMGDKMGLCSSPLVRARTGKADRRSSCQLSCRESPLVERRCDMAMSCYTIAVYTDIIVLISKRNRRTTLGKMWQMFLERSPDKIEYTIAREETDADLCVSTDRQPPLLVMKYELSRNEWEQDQDAIPGEAVIDCDAPMTI
ncbi:hypothetical protein TNCV_1389941 [Trichonephila clavipes]|nr:hypothetical protein TNCV_1389941 [Trichonephila clavipes]